MFLGQKQRSKIVISHPPVIKGGLQFGFKDGGQVIVPGIFRVHWSKHVKIVANSLDLQSRSECENLRTTVRIRILRTGWRSIRMQDS